jgi:glycosyltransferase involved in cell wall biosynthesis
MKRTLVFSDEYPPAGGGAGTVAAQLASDLSREGAEVHLLTGDEPAAADPCARTHTRVHRSTLVWPFAYRRALQSIDLASFDLIVINDFTAAYVAGLLFPAAALAKCVVIVHGEDSRYAYERTTWKHRIFGYRRAYTRLLRGCRGIVAVSAYAREIFARGLPFSVDAKLGSCYAGIALDRMPAPQAIDRSGLGIADDAIVLLSASRLVEEKGLLDQLELLRDETARGANYHWLIAGDGPLRESLAATIDRHALRDRVRLLGRLPRAELAGYFALADVFWLLSRATYETLGLVYIEAAFYGTPSIGLRNYGVIEAIDEGRSGFFYAGGSISSLIDRCRTQLRAQDCHAHAQKFSSGAFARHLLAHAGAA